MIRKCTATFTRPDNTSAYQANDLVANNTTAGNVVPMTFNLGAGGGRIVRIHIQKSDHTDVANATFSLRLFEDSPTVANGDNGAISHSVSKHIATVPLTIMVAGTDDAYTTINLGETNFVGGAFAAESVIYGLLEAEAAYGPAALEVFTVTLYVDK